MTGTLTSYTLLARDLPTSLKRKAAEAAVSRETAYFKAHIGTVKSVDDLMADQRLYGYAMKAYGLEDMTYAKAFMRKVLSEGTASATSFANRLADDRYVAFAKAFDFTKVYGSSGAGQDAATAETGTTDATTATVTGASALGGSLDFSGTNEASFSIATQVDATTTKTGTIVLNRQTLTGYARDFTQVTAAELVAAINGRIEATGKDNLAGKVAARLDDRNRLVLETTAYTDLGVDEAPGGTGAAADTIYAGVGARRTLLVQNVALSDRTQTAVDIGFGTETGQDARSRAVTDAYLRQSLEEDAGAEDTGVRLALYFARKAPEITSAYGILGDQALTQVFNTLIGLPATSGAASSDALERRAETIAAKIDIASLQDPAAVEKLARRFAAIWDAQNNTATAPILALFSAGDGGSGIGADMLLGLQASRLGF